MISGICVCDVDVVLQKPTKSTTRQSLSDNEQQRASTTPSTTTTEAGISRHE
jgi:hypothetical protein